MGGERMLKATMPGAKPCIEIRSGPMSSTSTASRMRGSPKPIVRGTSMREPSSGKKVLLLMKSSTFLISSWEARTRGRRYSLRSFSHFLVQGSFQDLALEETVTHLVHGISASHFSRMMKHRIQEPPLSRTAPAFSRASRESGRHRTPGRVCREGGVVVW